MSATVAVTTLAKSHRGLAWWLMIAAILLTIAVYSTGLSGSYLFDDYPNIVDNKGVQPNSASISSLMRAALSSPSSEFKRPLASLSFAANYLSTGLDPYWMKLTNLVIHLLNGLLVFLLGRQLLLSTPACSGELTFDRLPHADDNIAELRAPDHLLQLCSVAKDRAGAIAALIAAGWMLLPINLTAVLYVVQRMESMANLFVLAGLIGYVTGRRYMLATKISSEPRFPNKGNRGLILCLTSITVPAAIGLLAKETAIMLPLYALLIEWTLFRFRMPTENSGPQKKHNLDWRMVAIFLVFLIVPMLLGLIWIVPGVLKPETWATRNFTLTSRLLSESRIVIDYIRWILLPTPDALSFYHDDFHISAGLLMPWSTLASIVFLVFIVTLMFWLRPRIPLAALGIGLFLACQLLTGTIIPLELVYEHRNYFASFGLLLAIVPILAAPHSKAQKLTSFAWPRYALLAGLMLCWTALTSLTAYAWGDPLRLAKDLAARAPQSPRAQYELGRSYIIYSHYDPSSPFTQLAYVPLEKAAALPDSSILPEQALIFMNARMQLPIKDAWWDSLTAKLKTRQATIQDESSLAALTECMREQHCNLPKDRMTAAFKAALSHPQPSARLLANYGDYCWNLLGDENLGELIIADAVKINPNEPAYQITLTRMLAAQGRKKEALESIKNLQLLNLGGRLNDSLTELRALPALQ